MRIILSSETFCRIIGLLPLKFIAEFPSLVRTVQNFLLGTAEFVIIITCLIRCKTKKTLFTETFAKIIVTEQTKNNSDFIEKKLMTIFLS